MKRFLFTLVQLTWGLAQTTAGAFVYLATMGCPRFDFRCARGTVWKGKSSVSLGLFIFVSKDETAHISNGFATRQTAAIRVDPRLVVHEYGHCIQSLILGPLYLIVIGLPSFAWAMLPAMKKRRIRRSTSYYSLYTERWANRLGEKVTGMAAMR